MKKMKVALIGLKFNADEAVSTISINLPECSKFLSVYVKVENDEPCLWINYMAPSEHFDHGDGYAKKAWCNFQFVIVRCNYDEFEFDEHNYIATIEVGNDAFAIFYKKAE